MEAKAFPTENVKETLVILYSNMSTLYRCSCSL